MKDAEEELETTRNPIVARKAQEYIDLCALQLPMAGLQVHHISCGLMHTVCSAGECGCCFARVLFDTCTCNLLWSVCHCTVVFGIMPPRLTLFNLVVCVSLFRFFMYCYFRYCLYTLNLDFCVYNNTFLSPSTIETFFIFQVAPVPCFRLVVVSGTAWATATASRRHGHGVWTGTCASVGLCWISVGCVGCVGYF